MPGWQSDKHTKPNALSAVVHAVVHACAHPVLLLAGVPNTFPPGPHQQIGP